MAKHTSNNERSFKYLLPESYLAYIKNSVGTKMFRTFYVRDEKGKIYDVLKNGDLSCAVFVSTVLRNFDLIEKLHFTTIRTVEDLVQSGWKKVKTGDMKPGDVIVWEKKPVRSGGDVPHIGFYVGNNQAVSNSSKTGMIQKHHVTYKTKRNIEAVYRPNWKKDYAKS
ncbi:MAG TPA: NlpC/P60 family protein [Candidatus Binatia bacterium]|nr:NlpC/P60 family protein [Candidatus Binatia bacterium]